MNFHWIFVLAFSAFPAIEGKCPMGNKAARMEELGFCPIESATGIPVGEMVNDNLNFRIDCTGQVYAYRTITGACNNLLHPHWGKSGQPFRRVVPNTYADEMSEPQTDLPSARLLSSVLHPDMNKPDARIKNLLMQIGQFSDHDVSLAPERNLDCCGEASSDPDCFNIIIPSNDSFYSQTTPPQSCLPLTRSTPLCEEFKIREQFNSLTAYVDLSQVYGSSKEFEELVRGENGMLAVGNSFPNALPTIEEATGQETFDEIEGLFFQGDIRVNETPGLVTLHTLFFREHNRIAGIIMEKAPSLSDEEIFQLARRINIAGWQQVVYNEFLPAVVGEATAKKFLLSTESHDSFYDDEINSGMLHSFSTAAYRFGHSLINGIVDKAEDGIANGTYNIRDTFFNASEILVNNGDGLERIMEGLLVQDAQSFDEFVTSDVTNHLFMEEGQDFGQDLVSRNIQRGRDHGIGSYASMRKFCGLSRLTSEWDVRKPREIPQERWEELERVYDSPLDIELFPGGLSEIGRLDSIVGPTFSCLISYQFFVAKYGDRYFFSHRCQGPNVVQFPTRDRFLLRQLQTKTAYVKVRRALRRFGDIYCNRRVQFNRRQRNEIRRRRLSAIICDNYPTITMAPTFALRALSGSNRIINCTDIRPLNVNVFINTRYRDQNE